MSINKFCESISDHVNTGILLIDLDFNICEWNKFLQIHANARPESVIGKSIFDVFPELPQKWFIRKISSVIELGNPCFCSWEQRHHLFELPHTRPITTDSHFMAQNCTFLPIMENDKIDHICILIEDATDTCHYQTRLNHTLEDLALANRIDGLTQVYNRKHWEECLSKEFSRARRYDHGLALIMFDLDNFKLINDNYGHLGGDAVLVEAAKLIKSLLRLCDIFGRYGGEEFAVILPETDLIGATDVAERIRVALSHQDIAFQQHMINLTTSVGVCEITSNDTRYEDMIERADSALYKAKTTGRNKVCVLDANIPAPTLQCD